MEFILKFPVPACSEKIAHDQKIMLIGSCFTEEIGNRMKELKFQILQNPNGILYDPLSISRCVDQCVNGISTDWPSLANYNGLWLSWDHHSSFSHAEKESVVAGINSSHRSAATLIRNANWLILTFGSSYAYKLKENNSFVANCHKAPAKWFDKELLSVDQSFTALQNSISNLRSINPGIKIILTVSPVRHIKGGIIENNRSKARLLELVHKLCDEYSQVFYFPAYEIIIDVLRDYRFYKEDMVHPNEAAVNYVFEKFSESYFNSGTIDLIREVDQLILAKKHRPFHSHSSAFREFLDSNLAKAKNLQQKFPGLNIDEEINYFSKRE